jgi:hypothetical protein
MQDGHAGWTCRMDMQDGHAGWTCRMDMQDGHAGWTCRMDIQNEHLAWTCGMDMQHGHATWTCSMDMRHGHAAWTCSMDRLQRHEAMTCSIDLQHEQLNMQHGHAAWTCTCMYSPRQKSWPVVHKFNEKSYKQCQKCLLLIGMYRDHKQCWYLVIPLSWIMTSWTLVDMLIVLSLPDIGFLNLFWLRVLALWKPGPSSGPSQTP